jgi:hypothetical protein
MNVLTVSCCTGAGARSFHEGVQCKGSLCIAHIKDRVAACEDVMLTNCCWITQCMTVRGLKTVMLVVSMRVHLSAATREVVLGLRCRVSAELLPKVASSDAAVEASGVSCGCRAELDIVLYKLRLRDVSRAGAGGRPLPRVLQIVTLLHDDGTDSRPLSDASGRNRLPVRSAHRGAGVSDLLPILSVSADGKARLPVLVHVGSGTSVSLHLLTVLLRTRLHVLGVHRRKTA